MTTNYLNPDIKYKLDLLDIFINIKTHVRNGADESSREAFLEELCEKFGDIPANTLEANKEFWSAVYDKKFSELNEYYSITPEDKMEGENFSRLYHLKENEQFNEVLKDINKYSGSARFMDGYLQNKNFDLYRAINYAKRELQDLSNMGMVTHSNDTKIISPFYIASDLPSFLPISRRVYSVGQFFTSIESHKRSIEELMSKYDEFLESVESYNAETREKMISEHIRFATTYLKEILSRIIIPVSCLEDDKLRELCEEQGREVFVRKPEMKDFLFTGAHVHIYSSHDLEDDSNYMIKPILVESTIPADTEELKYHGVGIYSNYDDKSERSCKGVTPHVIGGVLYCGADLDEFSKVIPEILLEEIRICEKLIESMDKDIEFTSSEEGVSSIIKKIKEDDDIDVSNIVKKFLKLEGPSLTEEQERNLNNSDFESIPYMFNTDLLITNNIQHPNGFCIFKDNNGTYSAVKRDANNNLKHKILSYKVYGELAFEAACRALELPNGLYPIFDFINRQETRGKALVDMGYYTKTE